MNVTSFRIADTIIHEITDRVLAPPRDPELVLSTAVSPLDDDLREYFQGRIAESLRLAAFPVIADPDRSSPTPELVHQQLTDSGADFVETSRAVAEHLFKAQESVRSSPGLLVISIGTLDSGPALAILKLKRQEGVNLERTGARGAETYSLEHLRRLMLTNDTRVFKVALFEAAGVVEPDDIYALVSDKQRFSSPEKRMADFFLRDFLGCQLRDDPAQATSNYFVRGEKFFNERIASPEKRARYHRAMVANLTSQATSVVPRTFAREHLEDGDRQAFLDFLRAGDVSLSQFQKDTELIDSRLREEEYVLQSGIRVRGTQVAFDEHTEITERDGEFLEMLITDRLQSVKGASKQR
jgi:37-kD nucleoid-associated bacterial protein